jgi:hypothetical protein
MKDRLSRLDMVAIFLSVLCVVHCVATPLVLLAWPFLRVGPRDWFHAMMAAVLLIFALAALLSGYRLHRRVVVPAMGALGVGLLFLALFVSSATFWLVFSPEALVTLMGSALLIAAHILNYHHHRRHHRQHHHDDHHQQAHRHLNRRAPAPHRSVSDRIACSKAHL